MDCFIPNELYESLKTISRYQNCVILREICREYNWDFNSLKKKYIKDKQVKQLYNKKIMSEETKILGKKKIIIRKKIKKLKKENTENNYDEGKVKCRKIEFMDNIYYLEEDTYNVYNTEGEFVGIYEDSIINFDGEEIE